MCGIAGFVSQHGGSQTQFESIATAMNNSLQHRGPDDQGVWIDADAGIALAHRRLSIVDLSPAGHQPMISSAGRYVIIYNGEVYNHEEIRPSLVRRGSTFRGHSDTEVILESIAQFGIEQTLSRLIGMFSIALWDRRDRQLTLVRDRLGIKPLYWAKFGNLFLFGSELKALRAHPGWTPRIDRSAVAGFMRHNCVPGTAAIYEGVHKLEPGCLLTLMPGGEPRHKRFWSARDVARSGSQSPLRVNDTELTDQLEELLKDAVRRRMMADVPLGAFLSGGIDSSTVVALMNAANAGPVKTFTIAFENSDFDESKHAASVARHLGTEHTELMVNSRQALDIIPTLPDMYDEPFADASQIPTALISTLTRRHVTVALSGDGGDELFAGYNRYQLARPAWQRLALIPLSIRRAIAAAITGISAERWTRLLSPLPSKVRMAQAGDKLYKLASILQIEDASAVYRRLITHWEPADILPSASELRGVIWDQTVTQDFPGALEHMQFLDLVTYLPDDILTKLDRASMAVSLEARVPLIDHRLVEFAWRLPSHVKLRGGTTKWLLRQVLYRHVPKEIIERPKMGFAVPLAEWLRGPLRDWAETLLAEPRLREAGLLDVQVVRRHWGEHLSGRRNWQHLLWGVLMFEAWRQRWA